MTRQEMQDRLPKLAEQITEDTVWAVAPIYCLLDFDKDDFCKLINAIGLEKWLDAAEKGRWARLDKADGMLAAKERYEKNKARLSDIDREAEQLRKCVEEYETANRL